MSSGADELDAAGLARAFAAQLEHLRDHHGLRYVPGEAMSVPRIESGSAPAVPEVSATAVRAASDDLATVEKRVLRKEASQWSAERKLGYLREKVVGDCRRCPLARTRTKLVFGVGNPEADIMFVGEAPGRDEDRQGEPFVGAAGQKLDHWLGLLGLRREEVYIANVLKCRPPNNRDPMPREIETCSPFLHAQVRAIQPKVLIALGRFAGNLLLGEQLKMYEMRGRSIFYEDPKHSLKVPVVATYHPSYVLRREREATRRDPNVRPERKSEEETVLDDLRRARSLCSP